MIRHPLLSAAFAAVLVTALAPARANVPAPVAVAEQLPEARLAGEGDLRWFGIKVYTAQLWVGRPGLRLDRLASAPFALELRYATGLKGSAIAERSLQEMERMGYGDAQRRGRWLDAMKKLFPDVARGDRPIGGVDDPDFARAFFAIWLDERTVAPALRESLLRQAADAGGAAR
jgi:hypothetical protein